MERSNAEYLQKVFDEYNIKHDTNIGFDYDAGKYVTAYDLLMIFVDLPHKEQNLVMCDVLAAECTTTRKNVINALYDVYMNIRKFNRKVINDASI